MPLSQLLNQPCLITRRLPSESGAIDDYGNEIPDERLVETVCLLQQRQRAEPAGEGETSSDRYLLFLPAATVLTTADAVEVDGHEYEVVGDPSRPYNPRTRAVSHVEATVRRTAGAEDAS